ncbi:olfactory receptor 4C16-like [Cynocephalus volans]|uniref:olfactory receptor 4C16-like n=1 Tax=Cynocephalus volans TaxID=110931 RepID=UPI002FCC5854
MDLNNNVTEFILLGLTQDPVWKKIVFATFLLFYLGTLFGNLLIIFTIKTSRALQSPMYFFLFYLSLSDTCFCTSIAPRMIVVALSKKIIFSFSECMIQVFIFHFFGCLEIFILILMAADRYVAICKPLHYTTIISRCVCGMMMLKEVNESVGATFVLLGFSEFPHLKVPFFLMFMTIDTVTVVGNLGVIVVINIIPKLQTPMYFFHSHLSFLDFCYCSVVTPKLLKS